VKLKKTATETFSLLHEAYGENTLSRARVLIWHKRISEGREDVEDSKPEHPVTMKIDENVEKIRAFVTINIRMTEELNMSKETVRQILTVHLNMKKVHAKMVPKNLSEDQKLARKQVCYEIMEKTEDANLLNTVVTCNETWFLQYDLETK
jgi:hypothetical protein